MANSFLSPTIITREALRVLHQSVKFIGAVNRQYDNQFANEGASPSGKLGPALTIRLPNQFTVRSGATLQVQDIAESTTTLTVSTQKGVDLNFSAVDLTLTIDEFSARYLKPAMARLAAEMEKDALTMVKDVYNFVDDDAAAISFLDIAKGRQKLDEFLAPDDGDRTLMLCPTHNTKFIDAVKGLFNPVKELSKQYRSGFVGEVDSFDAYQTSLLVPQATGTAAKATTYTVNGGNLAISPSIVVTGAGQNVTASPTSGGNVVKVGAGASETYTQSVAFHKEAFAFVSADLIDVSKYGAWGARQVMDGISMRIARQYDITNDKVPARIDVLYGFKTIRPQLACRI